MKRLIVIALALLSAAWVQAKPARTEMVRYRQPDGSVVLLTLHGDAFCHYATDPAGRVLEPDANAYYRPSALPEYVLQRRMRAAREKSIKRPFLPRSGAPHYPVVLIAFQDVPFAEDAPQAYFQAFFNQEGFAEEGGTGSVRDYFRDNSMGLYSPVFDVYGPVTVPGNRADYGRDVLMGGERVCDVAPQKALYQACLHLDEEVDFAQYDADGDGEVDQILYIYAGYDQAEGGPADAIWAHSWHMSEASDPEVAEAMLDGVRLGNYLCASELMGNEGSALQGIGTTCHEFAHALGLPDFYDVDGLANGLAGGLYQFSLMCNGLYNNNSRTPPYLNSLERCLLGWMDEADIPELPEGRVNLPPVQENRAFRSLTATEGEYYLYETRSGTGWDAPLPAGLLVLHVDRSMREREGIPAIDLWDNWMEYNNLNNYLSHPCFYLIPATEPHARYTASAINPGALLFPGVADNHCLEPEDWDGQYTGVQLTAIGRDQDGHSQFRVFHRDDSNVSGEIWDETGQALAVAFVSEWGQEDDARIYSDGDGFFLLPLRDGEVPRTVPLVVSKPGYRTQSVQVKLKNGRTAFQRIMMPALGAPVSAQLMRYDPSQTSGYFPTDGPVLCGVRFPPTDLSPYVGMRLKEVSCHPLIYTPENVGRMWVTVDFDLERVLTLPVQDPPLGEFVRIRVDVSEANLRVPEGVHVYIGYGFEEIQSNAPAGTVYPGQKDNSYWSPFSLEQSMWEAMYSEAAGMYMDLMLSAVVEDSPAEDLSEMGFPYIQPGTGHYRAGETFPLKVESAERVSSVTWLLDRKPINGEFLVLPAGEHTLEAFLTYKDGPAELLQLVFNAVE